MSDNISIMIIYDNKKQLEQLFKNSKIRLG